MSYTQANEDGPSWMDRLPRIQSRSKSQMSGRRFSESSMDEKADLGETGPGLLPPPGHPGNFLRRQREEDEASRSGSVRPTARQRRSKWDAGRGPGGPISQSAIHPNRRDEERAEINLGEDYADFDDKMAASSDSSSNGKNKMKEIDQQEEIYQEGHKTVIEDKDGNVLGVRDSHGEHGAQRRESDIREARRLMAAERVQHGVAQKEHGSKAEEAPGKAVDALEHPQKTWRKRMQSFTGHHHDENGEVIEKPKSQKPERQRGPALAYQFGNTIIVEDEDGEVLKKYDIPSKPKEPKDQRPGATRGASMAETSGRAMQSLKRMGTHMGIPTHHDAGSLEAQDGDAKTSAADGKKKKKKDDDEDDANLRFTLGPGGRRMSKSEFIEQMTQLDPKARAKMLQNSNVPESVKREAHQDAKDYQRRTQAASETNIPPVIGEEGEAELQKIESPAAEEEGHPRGPEGLTLVDSNEEHVPFHSVRQTLADHSIDQKNETAAQRRRRLATEEAETGPQVAGEGNDEDETPAERRRRLAALSGSTSPPASQARRPMPPSQQQSTSSGGIEGETAAERRRRLGALGVGQGDSPESDSEGEPEIGDPMETGRGTHSQTTKQNLEPPRAPGIRFADQPRVPTKDERAAESAREKGEMETAKKSKLGGFPWGSRK